jgi:hypothetical protein
MSGRQAARALGWLGVGLGLAQLLAPRRAGRLAGVRGREGLLRAVGVCESKTAFTRHRPIPYRPPRAFRSYFPASGSTHRPAHRSTFRYEQD